MLAKWFFECSAASLNKSFCHPGTKRKTKTVPEWQNDLFHEAPDLKSLGFSLLPE